MFGIGSSMGRRRIDITGALKPIAESNGQNGAEKS